MERFLLQPNRGSTADSTCQPNPVLAWSCWPLSGLPEHTHSSVLGSLTSLTVKLTGTQLDKDTDDTETWKLTHLPLLLLEVQRYLLLWEPERPDGFPPEPSLQ